MNKTPNRQSSVPNCLIYSPYFKGIGGGERYMLSAAECLLNNNWQVDVFWDNENDIKQISQKLDLDTKAINVIGRSPEDLSFLKKIKLSRSYDIIFWLSNGSLPVLFGRKNIIHFQRPFEHVGGKNIITQIKLGLTNQIVCNSKFTKKYIDQEFGIQSTVLYPPVDVDKFKPGEKKNMILTVGRLQPNKKQDVLVKAFKQMVDGGLDNWKMIIAGGSLKEPKSNQYLQNLIKTADGYPIDFYPNLDFKTLNQFYAKSKLFWHAAGYGVVVDKEPWRCEHFGITPVEAMAAGCVPLVINKGGLTEIVRRGEGEKWKTLRELKMKSEKLINDKERYKKYQQNAILRSQDFSKQKFCRKLNLII